MSPRTYSRIVLLFLSFGNLLSHFVGVNGVAWMWGGGLYGRPLLEEAGHLSTTLLHPCLYAIHDRVSSADQIPTPERQVWQAE